MNRASLGAENKPLDRALGKLDGIAGGGGGVGGAPIPMTPRRLRTLELFLVAICVSLNGRLNHHSKLWVERGYNEQFTQRNYLRSFNEFRS